MKTIEKFNQFTNVSVSVLISIGCLLSLTPPLLAQVPSTPEIEGDEGIIIDGEDDPYPVNIWACLQGDKKIKVDAKNYSNWQETIDGTGWKCSQPEQIPLDVGGDIKFTCKPQDGTLGILIVTWLEGAGGKEQMQAWMEDIASQPGQGCQMGKVESWDAKYNLKQEQ